jgi:hypothetical protein
MPKAREAAAVTKKSGFFFQVRRVGGSVMKTKLRWTWPIDYRAIWCWSASNSTRRSAFCIRFLVAPGDGRGFPSDGVHIDLRLRPCLQRRAHHRGSSLEDP